MSNKFVDKKEFTERIFGEERYVPGSPDTKHLCFRISSGSSGKGISVVIDDLRATPQNYGMITQVNDAYIKFNVKYNSNLNAAHAALGSEHVLRSLFLTKKDIEPEHISYILSEFRPTEIFTFPFNLERLLESAVTEEAQQGLSGLRRISLTGQMPSATLKERLLERYPQLDFFVIYGSAEAWCCGVSCPHLESKFSTPEIIPYHTFPSPSIDILNPKSDGFGEIVASNGHVENYKTGDLGKILPYNCPCGATEVLLLRGRVGNDVIKIGGMIFLLVEFEHVFDELKELIRDFRVEIENTKEKGITLKYFLIPTDVGCEKKNLNSQVQHYIDSHCFVTKTQTVSDMLLKGYIASTEAVLEKEKSNVQKNIRLKLVSS